MNSNIKIARKAVSAELDLAKRGMAHYLSRVEALEQALAQLDSVGSKQAGADAAEPAARRKRKAGRTENNAQPASGARQARNFPATGGEFWLTLITAQPRSAVELANAAAAALGFSDDPSQVRVLKQRVSPALNLLVESQKIKDSGTGRERRFFKAE
jgi:hypothetical protein